MVKSDFRNAYHVLILIPSRLINGLHFGNRFTCCFMADILMDKLTWNMVQLKISSPKRSCCTSRTSPWTRLVSSNARVSVLMSALLSAIESANESILSIFVESSAVRWLILAYLLFNSFCFIISLLTRSISSLSVSLKVVICPLVSLISSALIFQSVY